MDLTKIVSINTAFNKFLNEFKKLNDFINNASPNIKRKSFLRLKDTDISADMKGLATGNIISLKKDLTKAMRLLLLYLQYFGSLGKLCFLRCQDT